MGWMYTQLGVMFDTYDGALREVLQHGELNQGEDTSDHFQNLILQYLLPWEIPNVLFLRQARAAYRHLVTVEATILPWAPKSQGNVIKETKKDPPKPRKHNSQKKDRKAAQDYWDAAVQYLFGGEGLN